MSTERWTAEICYNMQFGDHLQVTPDIQYIKILRSLVKAALGYSVLERVFI
ncbi:hypothetical protein O9993_00160 [Vibrio lentus]|nr:hypothetical protein [Vibrio lentus]